MFAIVLSFAIIFTMAAKQKYRLYVDESGSADYPKKLTDSAGKRYLSLTGVAISENECANVLSSKIENLKYLLTKDYDEKFTLHRDEIKDRKGVYSALSDPKIEAQWNILMKDLITNTDYTLFCVVIDKNWHKQHYRTPNHPYYYCLEVIMERYVKFLENNNGYGCLLYTSPSPRDVEESRLPA